MRVAVYADSAPAAAAGQRGEGEFLHQDGPLWKTAETYAASCVWNTVR